MSMTRAMHTTGSSPPASSVEALAAFGPLCMVLTVAIGLPHAFSLDTLYSSTD